MRISAATDYAVRALVELARFDGETVPLHVIAERQQISLRFLEHIFRDLRAAGLVASQRGGHGQGGYRLRRGPAEISLDAVVAATRPAATTTTRPASRTPAPDEHVLDQLWDGLEASLQDFLSGVTVADLLARRLPFDELRERTDELRERTGQGPGSPAGSGIGAGPDGAPSSGRPPGPSPTCCT